MKLFLTFALMITLAAVVTAQLHSCNTQEKGTPYKVVDTTQIHYQIVRDTVYIDRSRPINKPWYSYEIESSEDSIYLYSGRELIKALSRGQASVFSIDSLILLDNL